MPKAQWGIDDALMRGDSRQGVVTPVPTAPASIVRHVLYLEGPGRATPYCSVTEDEDAAELFAGRHGRVWFTSVDRIQESLRYISKHELLALLRGKGKGDASWSSASEVHQAHAYVEQWGEHLVDSRPLKDVDPQAVGSAFRSAFSKERP